MFSQYAFVMIYTTRGSWATEPADAFAAPARDT